MNLSIKHPVPPFVFIEHPTALKDHVLILQTSPPFLIGKVWRFKTQQDEHAGIKDIIYMADGAKVPGYMIYITPYNTLENGMTIMHLPSYKTIFDAMAAFFFTERILPNAANFKRYKEDN